MNAETFATIIICASMGVSLFVIAFSLTIAFKLHSQASLLEKMFILFSILGILLRFMYWSIATLAPDAHIGVIIVVLFGLPIAYLLGFIMADVMIEGD
jgi:hypothetical protein